MKNFKIVPESECKGLVIRIPKRSAVLLEKEGVLITNPSSISAEIVFNTNPDEIEAALASDLVPKHKAD